ncbi:hypothetical protein [Halovivax sp.]|uniref:hypothetical protein n=1 Tax=Halovivax sp. TaxID=1935978 RepID=UPI0025C0C7E4|nr:hypothetical protein [Halovivax sp.]
MVYATEGLIDVLLDLASEADPDRVSTGVSTTPAGELVGPDADAVDPETPVFTDFLLPDPGNALTHVFGVELSTPNRNAGGRFISHPAGELGLSLRDDLAEVVFIAVAPWEATDESLGAFDRRGERLPLELLDAAPPERPFETD